MIPILTDFYAGWLTFRIDNKYECQASYLEDTPQDLLDSCIAFYKHQRPVIVTLDEEDEGLTYVMIDWYISVIKRSKRMRFRYKYTIDEFAEELIKNIKDNMSSLINDFYADLFGTPNQIRRRLFRKIRILEKLMKGEK